MIIADDIDRATLDDEIVEIDTDKGIGRNKMKKEVVA